MTKKILMLEGSTKVKPGNSYMLGVYLLQKLNPEKYENRIIRITDSLKSKDKLDDLFQAVNECDLMILTFPLYADCQPAMVIKIMDLIAKNRREKKQEKEQQMIAMCNSGFPEPHQNETALDICRIFAKETGFLWNGGIGVGGFAGVVFMGSLKKKPESPSVASFGIKGKKIMKGLDAVANSLNQGRSIAKNGRHKLIKQMLPPRAICHAGNYVWRCFAKENGVLHRINDRPYEQSGM